MAIMPASMPMMGGGFDMNALALQALLANQQAAPAAAPAAAPTTAALEKRATELEGRLDKLIQALESP
jgi:hypothetical protein